MIADCYLWLCNNCEVMIMLTRWSWCMAAVWCRWHTSSWYGQKSYAVLQCNAMQWSDREFRRKVDWIIGSLNNGSLSCGVDPPTPLTIVWPNRAMQCRMLCKYISLSCHPVLLSSAWNIRWVNGCDSKEVIVPIFVCQPRYPPKLKNQIYLLLTHSRGTPLQKCFG